MKNRKKLAVLGNPIAHSLSPQMQTAALEHLGLQDEYEYTRLLIKDESALKAALDQLKNGKYAGFNVTIPWKEAVMKHLDSFSELANEVGAVNTIIEEDGKLIGHNTDGSGFLLAAGISPIEKSIVVLGAGGSAKAIIYAVLELNPIVIKIINRTQSRANELVSRLNHLGKLEIGDESDLINCDLVINTTPIGMIPNTEQLPLKDMSWCSDKNVVIDIIYNPQETQFLRLAKEKGATIMNGIGMLAGQGALALQHFAKISDQDVNDIIPIMSKTLSDALLNQGDQ